MNNQYKLRTFTCLGCEETVTKSRPANKVKYCSLQCYRSSLRPQRKTGRLVSCGYCDKKIYRKKGCLKSHKHYFCSIQCANIYQGRNKLDFICKTCGNHFKLSKSTAENNGNPQYCSITCRNKSDEWRRNATINSNLIQCRKKGLNKLEQAGSKILFDLCVKFNCEVLIAEKFVVDVYIPSVNIIIQWDGDYWHGHHTKLKGGVPDKRQLKRIQLDKAQDAYMRKCGYKVLRFWEHEVYNKPKEVIENIKRAIQ